MKRFFVLIMLCMSVAWPAAAGPQSSLGGEPKRSYGAIEVVMYQTSW